MRAFPEVSLGDAIARYHELLTPELAAETQERLDEQLGRRGLRFGTRPLCTVLRPRFLTPGQYELLRSRVKVLLGGFDRLYRAALADAAFRERFGLEPWEEELLHLDTGFPSPTPVSRIDAFFDPRGRTFSLTEYNAETPAAATYNDVLGSVFEALPIMREFLKEYEVRVQPARHNVLHALLEAHRHWSGGGSRPRVAILDWRDVPTYSEFVLSAQYFQDQGIDCVITDPREVEYRDGALVAEGHPVDLIYKRVLLSELVQREGLDHPVIRAVRDGAVCMVNPFSCKLLHKKASLAALSDERNQSLFGPQELEAIRRHVPWTRVVEDRRTEHEGRSVDLLEHAEANRERFVLKPNDEYGGKGIVLGWEVDGEAWSRALRNALDAPTVIQERLDLPRETYPTTGPDGSLVFAERIVDTAPFCFNGAYMDGCLTRLSTESLVNVSAGGGSSVATVVVLPR